MFELRIVCTRRSAEKVSEALEALDALSVSAEDADADTQSEQELFGEPGCTIDVQGWNRTRLSALYRDEPDAREAARLIQFQDFFVGCAIETICEVPQEDWVRLTQAQFKPTAITPDFWIVPSWDPAPGNARHVIRLDPGLAFGTGTHPTTRMCLRWIATHPLVGRRVLDYGCGSGILAIAAALFGAGAVDAVDVDPVAVRATEANAGANGVRLGVGLPEMARNRYDLVVANILASPLKVLAPLLCSHVADGGSLVLAGILERQTVELQEAYESWIALEASNNEAGWVLMTGRRQSSRDTERPCLPP